KPSPSSTATTPTNGAENGSRCIRPRRRWPAKPSSASASVRERQAKRSSREPSNRRRKPRSRNGSRGPTMTNRLHFSDLKHIAKSPAHYLYAVTHERKQEGHERLGTALHLLLLGQPERVILYDGRR